MVRRSASRCQSHFYPRSPCGERPARCRRPTRCRRGFLSTLSLRRATAEQNQTTGSPLFLSTLSLRRATQAAKHAVAAVINFYPRSPCGERLQQRGCFTSQLIISIHALLAESDDVPFRVSAGRFLFLSTLSLRRATRHAQRIAPLKAFLSTLSLRRATGFTFCAQGAGSISIHALLAESDGPPFSFWRW